MRLNKLISSSVLLSITCTFWIGFTACKNKEMPFDPLERNLVLAGKNRAELEKVMAHYQKIPRDSLKLKSAIFLISNIEDNKHYDGDWLESFDQIFDWSASLDAERLKEFKDSIESEIGRNGKAKSKLKIDLKTLTADYLIENIDQAYASWQNAPWKSSVSYNAFCNYILPYKSFSEYSEDWRTVLYQRYQYLLNDPDIPKNMEDVCCALVQDEKNWFRYTELFFGYPGALSIGNILKGQRGACREMSNLAAYSARALGIPVAIDYTPQWANHSDGHIWNALILNDSAFLHFLGAEGMPGDYTNVTRAETKTAKVYRYNQEIIESSFAARARRLGITDLPPSLVNPRIKDVTPYYTETADLNLHIKAKDGTPVYLCIFQNGSWNAMDGGFVRKHRVSIKNLGRDILYAPMLYKSETFLPAGPPLIIPWEGKPMELKNNNPEHLTLNLYRKYPLKRYRTLWTLAQYLILARFEGSNTPDFQNPTLLYQAPESLKGYFNNGINGRIIRDRLEYESLWKQAEVLITDSFRYVRIRAGDNIPFKLGELEFYTGNETIPLTGQPMSNLPHPERAFDGLPGYSIIKEDEVEKDRWVGLDLGQKKRITKIRYLPANDKNNIIPEKKYQLYYWKDKWVSIGIQIAKSHQLEYRDVPTGTIYWLHCKDCFSSEERPFTYENNTQIWW